jgi:hypothetical protein
MSMGPVSPRRPGAGAVASYVTEPEGRAAACTLTWTPAERRSRRAPSRNRWPPHRIERAAAARTDPRKAFITRPVLISDLEAPGAAGKLAGVLPEAAQLPVGGLFAFRKARAS